MLFVCLSCSGQSNCSKGDFWPSYKGSTPIADPQAGNHLELDDLTSDRQNPKALHQQATAHDWQKQTLHLSGLLGTGF